MEGGAGGGLAIMPAAWQRRAVYTVRWNLGTVWYGQVKAQFGNGKCTSDKGNLLIPSNDKIRGYIYSKTLG